MRTKAFVMMLCLALAACPGKRAAKKQPSPGAPESRPQKTAPPVAEPEPQCTGSRQCMLSSKGCCAPCWSDGLSSMDTHNHKKPPPSEKRCRGMKVDCADCKLSQGINPSLLAICRDYKCVGLDISKSPYSACKKDKDCFLTSTACCGCWDYPTAFSLEGSESFRRFRCPDIACAACEGPSYVGLSTACVDGHCVVRGTWDCDKERVGGSRCPVQRPKVKEAGKKTGKK